MSPAPAAAVGQSVNCQEAAEPPSKARNLLSADRPKLPIRLRLVDAWKGKGTASAVPPSADLIRVPQGTKLPANFLLTWMTVCFVMVCTDTRRTSEPRKGISSGGCFLEFYP
jgi:hypothetical protein